MTEPVSTGERIREMFSGLAPEYDRFNAWASLGLHRFWRRALAGQIHAGSRVLDLGAGTGALGAEILSRWGKGSGGGVTAVDFSLEMLTRGRRNNPPDDRLSAVQARGESLPFAAGRFDFVVSAFVLRNLQRAGVLEAVFREAYRVLRPSGRLIFLDLRSPEGTLMKWGHRIYLNTMVPAVGRVLFRDRWPGDYLKDTIRELLSEDRIRERFESAGFGQVRGQPLWGGVAGLFDGEKAC
ncbi:MAG TPA: class I SAM-dependent methyltransferase [Elusimicrobiota bacterium]|nr:class I SAM-dependent methyltransferase [Elusimicrobiota bacterium]